MFNVLVVSTLVNLGLKCGCWIASTCQVQRSSLPHLTQHIYICHIIRCCSALKSSELSTYLKHTEAIISGQSYIFRPQCTACAVARKKTEPELLYLFDCGTSRTTQPGPFECGFLFWTKTKSLLWEMQNTLQEYNGCRQQLSWGRKNPAKV